MARSVKKLYYVDGNLHKAVQTVLEGSGKSEVIRTRSRSSTITPDMIDLKIEVHNGRDYVPLLVQPHHVGHKLGEFALTRKRPLHPADRKAGKKK